MWHPRSTSMLSLLQFVAVARRQGLANVAWTMIDVQQSLAAMAEGPQRPLIASLSHLATMAGETTRQASLSFVVD